jgi:Lipocalin-like domain
MNGAEVVGSWRLVSARAPDDGAGNEAPFGSSPRGVLMYGADGRMSVIITHGGRSSLSDDSVASPTDHRAEAFATWFAYAGRYSLTGDEVRHHVEVSTVENWVATDLVRQVTLEGDRLILMAPMPIDGKILVAELVWERIT